MSSPKAESPEHESPSPSHSNTRSRSRSVTQSHSPSELSDPLPGSPCTTVSADLRRMSERLGTLIERLERLDADNARLSAEIAAANCMRKSKSKSKEGRGRSSKKKRNKSSSGRSSKKSKKQK